MSQESLEAATDEDLARLAAGGDGAAWAAVVERFEPTVRGHAVRLLISKGLRRWVDDRLDDVVAWVFEELFLNLHSYREDIAPFRVWFSFLRGSKLMEYMRQELRWESRSRPLEPVAAEDVEDPPLEPMHVTADGPAAVEAEDRALVVRDALGDLPAEFAVTIRLVHLEGLSHRDTADLLEISEGTVGSRLHRGMERLREALRRRGIENFGEGP